MTFAYNPKSLPSSMPRLLYIFTTIILITSILFALIQDTTNMSTIFQRLMRPFTSSATPMRFNPDSAAQNIPEGAAKCTLAAGCFWGVEHRYRHQFGGKGLYDAKVGYIGGDTKDPSYRAVCSGRTGREFALFT